jgi:type IV secretory pathway VirB3-like protein
MTALQDYALPVHKSMHQDDLLLGIPKTVMAVIVCAAILLVNFFGLWFGLLSVILYIPCRIISKRDPLVLNMALDTLFQVEFLEG